MNRKAGIVAAWLPLFASSAAHAQQNCTPIHFARGQSSAVVKGIARNSESPFACYTMTTGIGQTATLAIQTHGPNDDTAFTIPDVIDNQDNYTFRTEAKTYRIWIYRTFPREPDLPFTMRVTVR